MIHGVPWCRESSFGITGPLPETNSSPLKMGAPWKRRFLLETTVFRGYVGFRECNPLVAESKLLIPGKFLNPTLFLTPFCFKVVFWAIWVSKKLNMADGTFFNSCFFSNKKWLNTSPAVVVALFVQQSGGKTSLQVTAKRLNPSGFQKIQKDPSAVYVGGFLDQNQPTITYITWDVF